MGQKNKEMDEGSKLAKFLVILLLCFFWPPKSPPLLAAESQPHGQPPPFPKINNQADIEKYHGQRIYVEGIYEVEPFPGGKGLQAVEIILPDETRLMRSYRPIPREFNFIGKKVGIVGTIYRAGGLPPDVQQVLAPHLSVEKIDMASGQRLEKSPPRKLPPPPEANSEKQLSQMNQRWVQIHGRLASLRRSSDKDNQALAIFWLKDGTRVKVTDLDYGKMNPYLGEMLTVVGKVNLNEKGPRTHFNLVGRHAICAGTVPRCGMQPGDPNI